MLGGGLLVKVIEVLKHLLAFAMSDKKRNKFRFKWNLLSVHFKSHPWLLAPQENYKIKGHLHISLDKVENIFAKWLNNSLEIFDKDGVGWEQIRIISW